MQIRNILWILVFIVVVNISLGALEDGLISYYSFDSNYTDEVGNNDFVNNGTTLTPGIYGNAVDMTGTGDWIYTPVPFSVKLNDQDKTMCYFVELESSGNLQFIEYGTGGGSRYYLNYVNTNSVFAYDGASADNIGTAGLSWTSYCLQHNRTNQMGVFINGTYSAKNAFVWNNQTGSFWIGILAGGSGGTEYDGKIDQLAIWDRILTGTEISEYYANDGVPYTAVSDISISMEHTLNNTKNYNENDLIIYYNFSLGVDNTINEANCSLLNEGLVNATGLDLSEDTLYNFTLDMTGVSYNMTLAIICNNTEVSTQSNDYYYAIDTVLPTIDTDLVNGSVFYKSNSLETTFTFEDDNLFAYNITFLSGTTVTENYFAQDLDTTSISNITTRSLDDAGNFTIRAEVWDSHTANDVKPLSWYFYNNSLITGDDIYISGDIKTEYDKTYFYLNEDRYKLKITFNTDDIEHEIVLRTEGNLSFIKKSKYKGHFVYFPTKRWIDFEGKNIESIEVEKIDNNEYRIVLKHGISTDEIELESIGDLNYYTETYSYSVISEDIALLQSIDTTITNIYGVIQMIPIVLIWIVLSVGGLLLLLRGYQMIGILIYGLATLIDFILMAEIYSMYSASVNTATVGFFYSLALALMVPVWLLARTYIGITASRG